MQTFQVPYCDQFVNYAPAQGYHPYQTNGFLPGEGMCVYDDGYGQSRDESMNVRYYPTPVEDVPIASGGHGMYLYVDPGMAPMNDFSATLPYGNMAYCAPGEQLFYGVQGMSNSCVLDSGKCGLDEEAKLAESSTAATTPTLEARLCPEAIGDGFDIGYAYDFNATALAPMDCGMNIPSNDYYVNFTSPHNLDDTFTPFSDADALVNDAAIIEIANEIAANVRYLPDKEANGKYSLDSNHPIHCVWRDLNRGHCSWRCRWWENGKRLSKNFNVKRFGEREAMWMAIAMKIRNSTPVERYQLLKEQREAVRNHLELLRQHADGSAVEPGFMSSIPLNMPTIQPSPRKQRQSLSSAKRAQRKNWIRIAWTYVKVPERRSSETSVVCRLCAKTTKCSRRRNLQQAHIMHLLRMHKNPWKKYLDMEGLTKMCRSAIETLYQQQGFTEDSEWKLRPGLTPPEPTSNFGSLEETDSGE
ncbi:hypothetical protein X943_000962 [Babesia divergens]|uniref:Uncharacterized protein n=1 Tax=Babesia divergens TaxID=32595 RepID=A0AAD9GJD0_BABDI|nr:hypothetical protein X943_000962 [Babesia divergens]